MKVDGAIDEAINARADLYIRQSDLSNRFTRLDPAWFATPPSHVA